MYIGQINERERERIQYTCFLTSMYIVQMTSTMNIGDEFITCVLQKAASIFQLQSHHLLFTIFRLNGCDCQAQLTLRQFRQFVSILYGLPFKVNK